MSGPAYRIVSRAEARLDGRTHVDSGSRITGRSKALRGCGVSERLWQNKFCHAHSAAAFQGLESHHRRGRHRLDANSGWAALRGQSGEWLLWRGAGDELQIESQRHEVDRARYTLHQCCPHR